jgi:hypothetical protein
VWLWFNLLSLDAPLVAVVWQWFFARCYCVSLHWPGTVSLALSVWIIYVADRLLDSRQARPPATARHAFAHRYRRVLSVAALSAFPVLLWASSHLAATVIINGLVMSTGVVVYFIAVHAIPSSLRRLWPKELAVGVIFALGTSLLVWSRVQDQFELVGPALLFAGLCWLNCVAIDHWERRRVRSGTCTGHAVSQPHQWTSWVGRHLPQSALAIALASLLLAPSASARPVTVAAALSAAAFLWLEWRSAVLSLDALRVMADVALLSPALLLLFLR